MTIRQYNRIIKTITTASDKVVAAWASALDLGRSKEKDPYHLLSMAIKLHNQNKYDEALPLYQKTLELSPCDLTALHNRGALFHTVGRYDEALADFAQVNRTLLLRSNNVEALYNRAISFQLLGFLEDALDDLNRANELSPDRPDIVYSRARVHSTLANHNEAIADYERTVELCSEDNPSPKARRLLAFSLQHLGRFEEAMQSFSALIELDPWDEEYRHSRAYNFTKLQRFEDALADYRWALEHAPDVDFLLYYNLGVVNNKLARYEEALKYFSRSLEMRPDNSVTQSSRGAALYELGRLEEAEHDCDTALHIKPDNIYALALRSAIKARQGELEAAEVDLAKAAAIDSNEIAVRWADAALRTFKGDAQGAFEVLSDLIRNDCANGDTSLTLPRDLQTPDRATHRHKSASHHNIKQDPGYQEELLCCSATRLPSCL